ncbi:MAG: hypothetical protein E6K13_06075 [Methanobacteriota archaeon]|nr:MAG: hypothetical protein E6K13_06075 [Euryarchaeota archaeon]
MCPCAILGDRASGKTTFLGLLYAAQVRYGTGLRDDFRFHAPSGSLNLMSAVYEGMKDARFPSATLKEEITELSFVFGYLRKVVGKLPVAIREQSWVNPYSTLKFSAYDVSGEDIEEFIETGIASKPIIQQLLKAVVVVVMVDCSKMTIDVDTPTYKKMLKYDSTIAKLLVSFQTYKKQEYDRMVNQGMGAEAPIIYPAFVLAKFDTIRDEVLQKLGLHRGFPPVDEKRKRKDYAEALLRVFLPQTLSQIRGGKVAGVSMDKSAYFLSYVRTERPEGMEAVGAPKIVRIGFRPEGGGDPDFSYDEYVAFIEHFRGIAHKIPDEVREAEKFESVPVT